MSYRALLFCPDEKIARTVTQVLSELEFAVEPCVEPFAAVKKLMAEHFDAVVVDCDNDQNATLLFKSARNSAINQASLAVAVVEGQAGVAKAFRIGANLVLTKPINVEQAKGTLRVARGLLRKGEAAKPPVPASTQTPAPVPLPKPAGPVPVAPARPATLAAATAAKAREAALPASKPAAAIPARPEDQSAVSAAANTVPADAAAARPTVKATPLNIGSTTASSGAASAAAPAREAVGPVVETNAPSHTTPAPSSGPIAEASLTYSNPADPKAPESAATAAPTFTFGGANLPEKSASGGNKKVFLGIAAVVLVAGGIYFGWTQLHGNTSAPIGVANPPSSAVTKAPAAKQPPQIQSPAASAPPASVSGAQNALSQSQEIDSQRSNNDAASDDTEKDDVASPPSNSKPSASGSSPTTRPAAQPATKTAPPSKSAAQPAVQSAVAAPIVLKNGVIKPSAKPAAADASAPSMDALAVGGGSDGSLSNLTAVDNATKPILQTLTISQGVSQGLLLKKVQPAYPPTALRMRTEGAVKLLATIGKTGSVSNIKVLSGEPLLAHSAVDAVKQWKYKPYLLNGDPVEIQTEVTINFKLPN